ncbi:hypothetical protein SDC9_191118 [bioreactor metagenome]|uniref:Uncharacterized protein n=1 Tax=bioreactor metagenome TaxID=1076179 RepID=A0A645HX13_9ZZZZ
MRNNANFSFAAHFRCQRVCGFCTGFTVIRGDKAHRNIGIHAGVKRHNFNAA